MFDCQKTSTQRCQKVEAKEEIVFTVVDHRRIGVTNAIWFSTAAKTIMHVTGKGKNPNKYQ